MPWCPKCKNEYRAGFTECPDCKLKLIDSLNDPGLKPLCCFDSKEFEQKFCNYLDYSKLKYDHTELNDLNFLAFEESQYHEAEKALKAFAAGEVTITLRKNIDSTYFVHNVDSVMESISEELNTDDQEEIEAEIRRQLVRSNTSSVYESSKTKASEFSDSGYMLITIGILGIILIILNLTGVLNLFGSVFSEIVMLVMFAGMVIGGVLSIKSSKKYEENAVAEDKLSENINNWLESSLTKEDIIKADDPSGTDEENYLSRIDFIKDRLMCSLSGISDADENYIDTLVEEFYNKTFGE